MTTSAVSLDLMKAFDTVSYTILGSLSKDDGAATRTAKKIDLLSKTTTLHMQHTFFCTFLCRHCRTTTSKCLISRFKEDVNTRQRFSFSFCELRNSPLEFNSWKIRQHLTNWKSWNRSDEVWNSANSLFGWRFRCRCREMHLLPILLKLNTQGTFLKLLKTLKARVLNIT